MCMHIGLININTIVLVLYIYIGHSTYMHRSIDLYTGLSIGWSNNQ